MPSRGVINLDKVMAQQARRVLDRIVGYQISPLLWKKVTRGLSAGRVQSVAVKIVVEREREIRAFKPEEYWLIPAVFTTDLNGNYQQQWRDFTTPKTDDGKGPTVEEQGKWLADHHAFEAELFRIGDAKFNAGNQEEAQKVFRELEHAQFKVSDIETKESVSRASPPFITSTLQQTAANRLGFSTKRTMSIAQQLYEGIDLGSMGSLGLITYMRTDSTHVSGEALGEVRNYIQGHFGPKYLPEKPNFYAVGKSAQQAHEAIRPTDVDLTPPEIKQYLNDEQYKLYDLIWRRFVSCQMEPARWNVTTLSITTPTSLGPATYKAAGRVLVFDGYSKVWPVASTEQQLPPTQIGQPLATVDIRPEQHFTKPPARYTEASLVKALEKEGIGRPSTYAPIISTIQDRGVRRAEGPQVLRDGPGRGRHGQAQRVLPQDHGHRLHPADGGAARPDRGPASRLDGCPEGLLRTLQAEPRDGHAGDGPRQGGDRAQRVHVPGLWPAARVPVRQERAAS